MNFAFLERKDIEDSYLYILVKMKEGCKMDYFTNPTFELIPTGTIKESGYLVISLRGERIQQENRMTFRSSRGCTADVYSPQLRVVVPTISPQHGVMHNPLWTRKD